MTRWLRARGVLDRVAGLLLLLVLSPLILIDSADRAGGRRPPAFVRLERVGQAGRPFRMWKLRSMRQAPTAARAAGAPLTTAGDPRITPTGRRLRRMRLDELPQLLNVVVGEMALIGPRPETPEYVDATDDRWRRVLAAPPAIAGPTQALVYHWEQQVGPAAYADTVLPVKLAVDAAYLERASPWLDLLVLAATLRSLTGTPRATRMRSILGAAARAPLGVTEITRLRPHRRACGTTNRLAA